MFSSVKFMPQLKSDEDGRFWDMWYVPVTYQEAKIIRNTLINHDTPRDRLRILAVA